MSARDAWREAFPLDEAQRAAKHLLATWNDISKSQSEHFHAGLREPTLTERLWKFTESTSVAVGRLTGQWTNESPDAILDTSTGKFVKRVRKDITYFSNASATRLTLIFEFKKLTAASLSYRHYQGDSGLRRFADGHYAPKQPLAAMVGMVIGDRKKCIRGLRKSISKDGVRSKLRMVPDAKGVYLRTPSTLFPGSAEFDTEHNRPADQAPEHGTTMVSHMFIPLADAPS